MAYDEQQFQEMQANFERLRTSLEAYENASWSEKIMMFVQTVKDNLSEIGSVIGDDKSVAGDMSSIAQHLSVMFDKVRKGAELTVAYDEFCSDVNDVAMKADARNVSQLFKAKYGKSLKDVL